MIYLIIISVLFGLGRFFIQGHDVSWPGTYEAFAHIWVGILLVFCFSKVKEVRWISILSLTIITVLEAVMFFRR
jgi:hypothetical protein